MRVAAIALMLAAAPVLAQDKMPLSSEQQAGVYWLVSNGYSQSEATAFIHLGQAKLAACEEDARSRDCQRLGAVLDDMRARMTAKYVTGAAQPQTQRPQAR